jgi:hypothetical protein
MKRSSRMKSRVKRSKNRRYSKNRYTKRRVKRSKKKTKRGRAHIKTRKVFGGSPTREEVEAGPVGWTSPTWGDYSYIDQYLIIEDLDKIRDEVLPLRVVMDDNDLYKLYTEALQGNEAGSDKVRTITIDAIKKKVLARQKAAAAATSIQAAARRKNARADLARRKKARADLARQNAAATSIQAAVRSQGGGTKGVRCR